MMTFAEHLSKYAFHRRLASGVLLCTLAVLAVGCAIGKDTDSAACAGASPETLGAQSSAFSSTLYPALTANNCNQCHDGSGKAPYSFASSDPGSAVGSALKVVNLKVPADSRVISKVGAELHQCGGDPTRCQAIAAEFRKQIEAWSAQTQGVEVPKCDGNFVTLTTNVRTIAPTELVANQNKPYTFDLNGASAGLGKVGFSIEARLFQAPTATSNGVFILRAPTVATAEKKLKIGPIKIMVNGRVDEGYSNYTGVDYVVDAGPFELGGSNWNFPWVSTATQLVAWENRNGDEIAFQVSVAVTEEPADNTNTDYTCYERATFNDKVMPILNARCVNCHGTPNNQASNAYSITLTADQCSETIKKVNFTTPASSILLRKGRDGAQSHPGGSPLSGRTTEVNEIISWIQAEADARR